MDLKIIKQNSESFKLSDYDTIVRDIRIGSIPTASHRQKIDGIAGTLSYGQDLEDRPIEVDVTFVAKDLHDYVHLRDQLYNLLIDTTGYHIRELRRLNKQQYKFVDLNESSQDMEDTDSKYVNGKQYHVELDGSFEFDQDDIYGETTIKFITKNIPFAESIYTTKELNDSDYSALVERYGLVDSINSDKTKYKFTERNFSIWNAGNETVEPETMYLKITATGTNGNLEIKNKTTNDVFKVNAAHGGALIIDGMNIQLNGVNVFRDTNKRYISLAPGINIFEVIGQFTDITIDFRFYYK